MEQHSTKLTQTIILLFSLTVLFFSNKLLASQIVHDIAGRAVMLPDTPPQRIILGEGRLIAALSLLEREDPFAKVVGWQGDFKRSDPQNYQVYQSVYPAIDDITLIGGNTAQSVSVEQVLSLNPDLAILGLSGHGPGLDSELLKQLEKAKVPVIFVDFRTAPLSHTLPSIELLGKVLHKEAQAARYIEFYKTELARVTQVIQTLSENQKPSVFIELKAGTWGECCHTAGKGNMGDFIDAAGGINIAKSLLPAALGQINLEKVLTADPDIYIATGNLNPGSVKTGLILGAMTPSAVASASGKAVLALTAIQNLKAIQQGKAYGIWHGYYNSPYNVVAIQVFAKWFYPEQFKTLDPNETLSRLYQEFLPIPLTGTYWLDL